MVSIAMSNGFERIRPSVARPIPKIIERRTEVCIAFSSFFSFLAPKCCATITPAPEPKPRAKLIRQVEIIEVQPTAARAFGSLAYLPTTILSAIS